MNTILGKSCFYNLIHSAQPEEEEEEKKKIIIIIIKGRRKFEQYNKKCLL